MCKQSDINLITDSVAKKAEILLGDKLDGVILYGSYARGDFDEESDIDILVRVKCKREELRNYMFILTDYASDLSLKYDIMVSVLMFDTETFFKYENSMPFLVNVKKEGKNIE